MLKVKSNPFLTQKKKSCNMCSPFPKYCYKTIRYLVELSGIEPLTSTLPVLRSPS